MKKIICTKSNGMVTIKDTFVMAYHSIFHTQRVIINLMSFKITQPQIENQILKTENEYGKEGKTWNNKVIYE